MYCVTVIINITKLCNDIVLGRLFNAKDMLVEEQLWCYFTHSYWEKGFYDFLKSISTGMNVIVQIKLERACCIGFNVLVLHVSYHTIVSTTPYRIGSKEK